MGNDKEACGRRHTRPSAESLQADGTEDIFMRCVHIMAIYHSAHHIRRRSEVLTGKLCAGFIDELTWTLPTPEPADQAKCVLLKKTLWVITIFVSQPSGEMCYHRRIQVRYGTSGGLSRF